MTRFRLWRSRQWYLYLWCRPVGEWDTCGMYPFSLGMARRLRPDGTWERRELTDDENRENFDHRA